MTTRFGLLFSILLVPLLLAGTNDDFEWGGAAGGPNVEISGKGWGSSVSTAGNRPVTPASTGGAAAAKPHGSVTRQSNPVAGNASWATNWTSAKERWQATTRAAAARRSSTPIAPTCPTGFVKVIRADAMGCVHSSALAAGTIGTAWVPFGTPAQTASAPVPAVDAAVEDGQTPGGTSIDPSTLITIEDVQRLITDAGAVQLSPARSWVYVNKPVYYSTDAAAHDEQLVVLGQNVTVHLDPVSFRWDPGDGTEPFTTSTPGGSWPDGTVTYTYLTASSDVSVRLEVTWQASFTVGGVTYPITGNATGTATSDPFTVREAEAVLDR
ncbi:MULTISPECIES: hypothetical protein [unclassified Actinobaculum]|uniref:hypothetical protein n=1 Tax=unclassified Actinobaculum TaxID=2609299 RepID=UPI000D52893E|nr:MULTISPECIES: hypothetical protein [unclassified Actinobaculum]AWE42191.1 hypothetical protein DDD63_04850 [Actinobaculum sp. 313]RTE50754.1 hypothetical protein EKN07_01005 [Actinobaculum sp. 352]